MNPVVQDHIPNGQNFSIHQQEPMAFLVGHMIKVDSLSIQSVQKLHPKAMRIAMATILTILTILGIVGNTIVILLIYTRRRLHTPCNLLIANISVVGLLSNIIILPMFIANIIGGKEVFPVVVCRIFAYWNYALILALLANSTVIALHRFVILKLPRIGLISKRHMFMIVVLWVCPLAAGLLGIPFFGYNPQQLNCIFVPASRHSWYLRALLAAPAALTLGVIFVCYILICCKVKASRNKLTPQSTRTEIFTISNPVLVEEVEKNNLPTGFSNNTPVLRRRLEAWTQKNVREVKVTIHLTLIFTLMCAFWTPLMTLYFIHMNIAVSPNLWLVFSVIARSYTSIFWFLHLFLNHSIKTALRQSWQSFRAHKVGHFYR